MIIREDRTVGCLLKLNLTIFVAIIVFELIFCLLVYLIESSLAIDISYNQFQGCLRGLTGGYERRYARF